jgi:hypothetical protein
MAKSNIGVNQLDTRRNPSDAIWNSCPWLEIFAGDSAVASGCQFFDDFLFEYNTGANAQVPGYKVVGTNGTAALLATDDGGVMQMATSTSAANESYLCFGSAVGSHAQFKKDTRNQMWFETRFRVQDITNASGYFLGLTRPSDMASAFLTSTSFVRASADYVGLANLAATPTKMDIVYNTASTETVYVAGATTLVVNTWVKFGWHYFGSTQGNKVRFYINGQEVANTAGTLGVAVTAANFPNAVQMAAMFAAKEAGGSVATKLEVDWWRFAQTIDDQ